MRLYNGDCLEVMNKLIEEGIKVDTIITDPPYELSKHGGTTVPMAKRIGKVRDNIDFMAKGVHWNDDAPLKNKYKCKEFPTVNSKEKLHITQKPLKLIEELVELHSLEGDVVLDMFCGSGTTGIACKNLKRDFIGIEIDKDFFEIAKERIKNG